jgi:PLD-like domain/Helix-hairpin-helix motif
MYRFNWSSLATENVLAELESIANTKLGPDRALQEELLEEVLQAIGGLPIALSEWDADHQKTVAMKLIREATLALLRRRYGFNFAQKGLFVARKNGQDVVSIHSKLNPNFAAAVELEKLPVLGTTLSKRIVAERRRAGPFATIDDLTARIPGLGQEDGLRLSTLLYFDDSEQQLELDPEDFRKQFQVLAELVHRADPDAEVLESLLVFVSGEPHPATRFGLKRDDLEPETIEAPIPIGDKAAQVQLLLDRTYYQDILSLLESANSKIDICMFFMAFGGEDHPTRPLLEALVRKASVGCRIRVLLDRDDVGDPYGSRIVNSHAARYLSENGVTVHHDKATSLLHSKFILLDTDRLVIGSHNWTAGSYMSYKDVSFVIKGGNAVNSWQSRFDALWSSSMPY